MRSKNRDEKNKQDDAIYYIKTLIEECTIHVSLLYTLMQWSWIKPITSESLHSLWVDLT